ncbi:hypothetical protein A9996_18695 [Gelidibacter algens]|uniref:carboxypeptidase regulatory-like domain-containing protein n=1 Tax=Gelidibacter algens TaxID=49280 RepID=UPI0008055D31|nr:carboxypeptidase regulatory-like domain-containing protein [Gelidibacter algens]OBX20984.1 hypothetical protein A9996_18695 [Gelidibacter algens]
MTIIYPKEKFNKEASENHLAEGTSGIKGVLFTKEKSLFGFKAPLATKIYGINKSVLLFPVSDYFKSWYELRSKKENKKTRVYMSDEAFAQRFETTTDNFGRFNFEKLKPGKYFLQAFMELTITYNKEVNTGTGYT